VSYKEEKPQKHLQLQNVIIGQSLGSTGIHSIHNTTYFGFRGTFEKYAIDE
jgi:hypothetical protein